MRSLLIILATAAVSYQLSDVRSGGGLRGLLFPFIFSMSLLALVVWVYLRSRRREGREYQDSWDTLPGASGHRGDADD